MVGHLQLSVEILWEIYSSSVITLTNKRPGNNLYYSIQMDGAQ